MWRILKSKAGAKSVLTNDKFTFVPKTNWFGEYPPWFCNAFFVETAHAKAVSTSHFASFIVFMSASYKTSLFLSTTPLLNYDSPGVALVSIPNFLFISLYTSFANYPLELLWNLPGAPK